jgi:hypothetical protein
MRSKPISAMLSTDAEVTCSEGSLALAISSSTKSKSEIVVSVSVVTATVGLARGAFSPGTRVDLSWRCWSSDTGICGGVGGDLLVFVENVEKASRSPAQVALLAFPVGRHYRVDLVFPVSGAMCQHAQSMMVAHS